MGRTSKPLTLLVSDELADSEPVQKMVEQGHTIDRMDRAVWTYDLILGPNCQFMTLAHLRYLPDALKRARALRYGENTSSEPQDERSPEEE